MRGLSTTDPPSPGDNISSGWLTGDIKRVEGASYNSCPRDKHARAQNNRSPRFRQRSLDGTKQDECEVLPEGIATIFLWGRTWDRDFEVEVRFGPEGVDLAPPLSGKPACEYSEYLSGIAGVTRVEGWIRRVGFPGSSRR